MEGKASYCDLATEEGTVTACTTPRSEVHLYRKAFKNNKKLVTDGIFTLLVLGILSPIS